MNKSPYVSTVENHFLSKDPIVREIYARVLEAIRRIGSVIEEPKKTSIHLVNSSALAGVATRKDSLILTLKSDRKLTSPRIHKSERVSAGRFHYEVKLRSPSDIDNEVIGWLREAYRLSSKRRSG